MHTPTLRRITASALLPLLIAGCQSTATTNAAGSAPWVADLGDGRYQNPILYADYSDPDVIRVGDTYYMTASSFNATPGLPLLTSKDLVNWELVGHALPQLTPAERYVSARHGEGVWAPCIRYHDGKFWIFYPDPDNGYYDMFYGDKPAGSKRQAWNNAEFNEIITAAKGELDPEARLEMYKQAERIIQEDVGYMPIVFRVDQYAFKPWVKDVAVNRQGFTVPFGNIYVRMLSSVGVEGRPEE